MNKFIQQRTLSKLGKWAVVTGSTDGIGKAMAKKLALKGLSIVLISRSQEKLDSTKTEILDLLKSKQKPAVEIKTIAIDFSEQSSDIYKTIQDQCKSLEIAILVNNVGISYPHALYYHELSDELVQQLIDINVKSVLNMTKLFYKSMCDRRSGLIVNVSSAAATLPSDPLYAGYAATKAVSETLTRSLAVEAASFNVIVQCHAPMLIPSKLSKVRAASFFSPSPDVYAASAVHTMEYSGSGTYSPYIGHQLQGLFVDCLPSWLWAKIRYPMTKSIRARALKKNKD